MTRTKGEVTAMAWVLLVAAGLFETGFAVFLKLSHGMSRPWPTAGFAACGLVLPADESSRVMVMPAASNWAVRLSAAAPASAAMSQGSRAR